MQEGADDAGTAVDTMADGKQHRFLIDKYDAFTAELRNQIAKHAKLVDAGEERWQVVAA